MSWSRVGSNLGQRAQADLSFETVKSLPPWGLWLPSVQGGKRAEVQMEACPLSLSLAAALFMGWRLQAAVGGLLKGLGNQASYSPGGSLQFITSECLEHLMCRRSRNLCWIYNQDTCCAQTSAK